METLEDEDECDNDFERRAGARQGRRSTDAGGNGGSLYLNSPSAHQQDRYNINNIKLLKPVRLAESKDYNN